MIWWMLAAGLLLLTAGAEFLVRGASRLAALCGISPLVIGLTVVAYGTSMPELAVSVKAGMSGLDNIAVANVVGSNIFNVLFILGVCALVLPLKVSVQLVRWDVPIMIAASVLLMAMGRDNRLSWLDGVPLFGGIVGYTVWSIRKSRREAAAQARFAPAFGPTPTPGGRGRTMLLQVVVIALGLVLLMVGARWLVEAAVALARAFGISETVIGLTIVAAGTSLPELATSFVAAVHGEREIAIGNVVGSNLYNILAILGLCAILTPGGLAVDDSMVRFDIPVMVAVALACLPIFFTGYAIDRGEGILFLGAYATYVVWLILEAVRHPAFGAYSRWALHVAAPLIVALLLVRGVRACRRGR